MTPLEAGTVMRKGDLGKDDKVLDNEIQQSYCSLTAVMLHMMKWSCFEIINAVRECS